MSREPYIVVPVAIGLLTAIAYATLLVLASPIWGAALLASVGFLVAAVTIALALLDEHAP